MRVLLLGLNYKPEAIGIAVYSAGLAEDLVRTGHEVRAVVAKPYYPEWRVREEFRGGWKSSTESGVDLVRCPLYVPAQPTGAKRILHHLSFAVSTLGPMLSAVRQFRPELVISIAPSLIAAPVARLAARLARAPAWLHVQDFEVEAAFATGLLDASRPSARLARRFERSMLRGFDCVSSISPEMCRKLTEMGIPEERVVEFRNWADLDLVRPLAGPSPYRAEWGITAKHVALYSGNIANKQGIEIVVEAAKRLRQRTDIQFIVCGEGPNREPLEAQARDLPNLLLRDLQPVERLGELLGLATVHLLPQKAGAADLVLPSKLTNMLASGRPVIATAPPGTGLAREVEGCGLVTTPGDEVAFAEAIERLIDDGELWRDTASAARARAETVWSGSRVRGEAIARMEGLGGPGASAKLRSTAENHEDIRYRGFRIIGTSVVRRLLELGIPCANFDLKPPIDPAHHSVWTEGDLLDAGRLNSALLELGADQVIHLGAKADITSEDWESYASIHRGTMNLLRAIEQAPAVRRLANISTQLVVGPGTKPRSALDFHPYTVYGEAKAFAEAALLQWTSPLHWFTYRPANIWGPHHPSFADAIWKYLASGHYLHPGGKPVYRSYGYVDNTADQIIALLTAESEQTYRQVFYGADAVLDSAIWVDAFSHALVGRPARRVPVPLLKLLGVSGDVVGKLGIRPPIDSGRAMRMTIDYPVPVEPTLAIAGAPRVSFEQGVARSIEWLRGRLPQLPASERSEK